MNIRCMSCMNEYDEKFSVCPHCSYVRGTMAAEPHHMNPETILHKKYIVGKVLGFGGFGVTYIGWDAVLNIKVAIKEYLPSEFATRIPGHTEISVYDGQSRELFSSGLHNFIEEAQRLAKFNSVDGIVDIYDAFQENNTAYIVMEYLEGQTLAQYLKQNGPMPYDRAMDVMVPVLSALSAVHGSGIIHRDISPDNIFITNTGDIKLLDFGSSRYATAYNSRSLSVIVKRGYAPPEQYSRSGAQGPWSDNYAVAATLYKTLTGITPEDSMDRSANDTLQPPSAMGVDIYPECENALMNALNLSPASRPQTAGELLNGLTNGTSRVKDDAEKKGGFPLWLKILSGAVASIVLLVGILFATGTMRIANGKLDFNLPFSNTVKVPDVIKKNKTEAKSILKDNKLSMLITGKTEPEDKIEKDLICDQNPKAGDKVKLKEKDTVEVKLSAGIAKGYVPDTQYYTKEAAIKSIEDEGLVAEIKEEYSDTVGKGGVISQSKSENTALDKGSKVDIAVSKGKQNSSSSGTVTIPDLKGKDFETARQELLKQGVFLLINKSEYSDTVKEDAIMSQSANAGTKVSKGDNVYVKISLGKEKVRVPDVTYMTKYEAVSTLHNLGLKTEIKNVENDPEVLPGLVLSQSSAEGTLVEKGSKVIISINSEPDGPAEPDGETDFILQSVEGKVVDIDSETPIEDASVVVLTSDGEQVDRTSTDKNGSYSFELKPDNYTIKIDHSKYTELSTSVRVKDGQDSDIPTAKMKKKTDPSTTTTTTTTTTTKTTTTATKKPEPAQRSVTGTVLNSSTNRPIKDVAVRIERENGSVVYTINTDSSGRFSVKLPDGKYVFRFTHNQYNNANKSVTVSSSSTSLGTVKMLQKEAPKPDSAYVSGNITDALTGRGLSGVTVRVRRGSNVKTGSYVSGVSASTGSNGAYSFRLPNGSYTIEAAKSGYINGYTNVTVDGVDISGRSLSLSPELRPDSGEMRIVLNWGSRHSDLDSHLVIDGENEVYFNNDWYHQDRSDEVHLDVDDTTYYGPETITIKDPSAHTYYYFVHQYSDETTPLSESGAQVTVYYSNGTSQSFYVPSSGSGEIWNVLKIQNGRVVSVNRVSDDIVF